MRQHQGGRRPCGRRRAQASRGALVRADRGRHRRVLRQVLRRGLPAGHRDRLGMLRAACLTTSSPGNLLYDVIKTVHEEAWPTSSRCRGEGDALERCAASSSAHRPRVPEHDQTACSCTKLQRCRRAPGRDHRRRARLPARVRPPDRGRASRTADPPRGDPSCRAEHPGSVNWVYRWFRPGGEFTAGQIGEQFRRLACAASPPRRAARLTPRLLPSTRSAAAGEAAPAKAAPARPLPQGRLPPRPRGAPSGPPPGQDGMTGLAAGSRWSPAGPGASAAPRAAAWPPKRRRRGRQLPPRRRAPARRSPRSRRTAARPSPTSAIGDDQAVQAMTEPSGPTWAGRTSLVSKRRHRQPGRPVADTEPDEYLRLMTVHALGPLARSARCCRPCDPAAADIVVVPRPPATRRPSPPPIRWPGRAGSGRPDPGPGGRAHGIRVNVVAPGLVATDMAERLVRALDGRALHDLDASYRSAGLCR